MSSRPASERSRSLLMASAVISAIIVVVLLIAWSPRVALGYAGGVVTGAGMLSALAFVLNRLIVPSHERSGSATILLLLHAGKFLLAAALAYLFIVLWEGSAGAFAVGYTVALATMIIIISGEPPSVQMPQESAPEDDEPPQ